MKSLRILFVLTLAVGIFGISLAPTSAYGDEWHVHIGDVWFSIADQEATLSIENTSEFDIALVDYCSPADEDGLTLYVGEEEVESIVIEAGTTYEFEANETTFELEGLTAPLAAGDAFALWLEFERLGEEDMDDIDEMDMDDEGCDFFVDDMDDMDDMDEMEEEDAMYYQEYLIGVPALDEAPADVDVFVMNGWTRPQAPITAAYVRFYNPTDADVNVVGIGTPFANVGELHTTVMENDVMQMRPVTEFVIPAGEHFDLMPGGNHFMLIDVTAADRFTEGLAVPLTITFGDGTELTIAVPVLSAPFGGDPMDMGMDMDHGGSDEMEMEATPEAAE